jgi:hypothetical protein
MLRLVGEILLDAILICHQRLLSRIPELLLQFCYGAINSEFRSASLSTLDWFEAFGLGLWTFTVGEATRREVSVGTEQS